MQSKIHFIKALQNTYLKKQPLQSSVLSNEDKQLVIKGTQWGVEEWGDRVLSPGNAPQVSEIETDGDGHELIKLAYGAGVRYIFAEHWECPWHKVSANTPETPFVLPEWDDIDWTNWSAPVSKYFTVGEVTNMSRERIPHDIKVKQNVVAIARRLDAVREWWGSPLLVTSFYRPWAVNRRIGSSAPNHPEGHAVDFRPLNGSVFDLQERFRKEWYEAGKWNGGFGLGAKKGFIHLDLRGKRMWLY